MEKITLASIKALMDSYLVKTEDAEERRVIVGEAKRAAFNLGALDTYAELTKQPQEEFWDRERDSYGGCYSTWDLPDFCRADVDDFEGLAGAYNAGTYEGEAAAERYNEEVLPCELERAKFELAQAENDGNRFWIVDRLDKWRRVLEARLESDECGWGENWWEE